MVRADKAQWKAKYFEKLIGFLNEYNKILIVGADNVGSSQMQQIRYVIAFLRLSSLFDNRLVSASSSAEPVRCSWERTP